MRARGRGGEGGAAGVRSEVGSIEVGSSEVGSSEVGSSEAGSSEVGRRWVGSIEVGRSKAGSCEVGRREVIIAHLLEGKPARKSGGNSPRPFANPPYAVRSDEKCVACAFWLGVKHGICEWSGGMQCT